MRKRARTRKGSGLIEAVTAAIILVPLALCMLDLIVIVIANCMNDTAVKNAARAAANQNDGGTALNAAQNALAKFQATSIIKTIDLQLALFDYPADKEAVTVETKMTVHLPVPFPGISEVDFMAKDVEPIVAQDVPQ
jgi:hypothetical protein